jgi:hypothetical protein
MASVRAGTDCAGDIAVFISGVVFVAVVAFVAFVAFVEFVAFVAFVAFVESGASAGAMEERLFMVGTVVFPEARM